jgi:hypothetical protein
MLKTTYECGAGSSDQAREVRTKGRLLVENYFNGPLTRFNNKSGLNAGTPLARGSDAMYTAALFNSDDRRVQYTGILGFHFSVDGELMPRPVVPNSFEDGPARVGVKLGGTLLFSGSQPGVACRPTTSKPPISALLSMRPRRQAGVFFRPLGRLWRLPLPPWAAIWPNRPWRCRTVLPFWNGPWRPKRSSNGQRKNSPNRR